MYRNERKLEKCSVAFIHKYPQMLTSTCTEADSHTSHDKTISWMCARNVSQQKALERKNNRTATPAVTLRETKQNS